MDAVLLRRFAQRMRDLMLRARTETAREQLRIWAEEFEARADALDAEEQGGENGAGHSDSIGQ
ncbi:MAG: hypothetical protein JO162_16380 [Alphaproteobacteria bacterium]|nr:hypothetical protein [Alphaproteobacteria bacterium]MBV9014660.1 hypothetical protein [Alphaproteobacteria bacterium]MBV9583804.1 hypothetical protein [Alphaproteobacteria bacterium]MBV9965470.1 hypothetical protein [Alphaproteobacteria bacterium]